MTFSLTLQLWIEMNEHVPSLNFETLILVLLQIHMVHHVEWKLLLSNTFCIPICLLSIFCAWTYTLLGIWQIRKYSDLQKNVYIVYITYCCSWCWNTKQTQSNSSWLYRLLIMRLTHFFQCNQNVATDCHSIYLVTLAWLQLWSLEPNKPQGVNIRALINHTPIIFSSELNWIDGSI